MATNIPFTGKFKVTCEFDRKGNAWKAGRHTGIDLVGIDSKVVYSTCSGKIFKIGYSPADYGNYVIILSDDGDYHYLCHLASVCVSKGQEVSRLNKIGVMGSTGKVAGAHTHFEIRTPENKYNVVKNPAEYMGIPNTVGSYNSADYQLTSSPVKQVVEQPCYYPKCPITTGSIVDALKAIGEDSSLANRKVIANKNGMYKYTGTKAENIAMLDKLKNGTLIK